MIKRIIAAYKAFKNPQLIEVSAIINGVIIPNIGNHQDINISVATCYLSPGDRVTVADYDCIFTVTDHVLKLMPDSYSKH